MPAWLLTEVKKNSYDVEARSLAAVEFLPGDRQAGGRKEVAFLRRTHFMTTYLPEEREYFRPYVYDDKKMESTG